MAKIARDIRCGRAAAVGSAGGYTFVELLVVSTIIMILASAVMPLARVTAHAAARSRAAARAARNAHGDRQVQGRRRPQQIASLEIKAGSEGYPPDLETLVDGVAAAERRDRPQAEVSAAHPDRSDDAQHGVGLRSYQDDPDATRWGGQNVFDVYTTFDGTALDGTKYRDW